MIIKDIKYSYGDLEIVPERLSAIKSRSECNPRYDCNGDMMLPIFTAPMDSVVDDKNYMIFKEQGIIPIIHSNVVLSKRIELTENGEWCAYGIADFKDIFYSGSEVYTKAKENGLSEVKVLIDVANGHMKYMLELASETKSIAKNTYGITLVIMCGNIANPKTYYDYCNAGIDYVRCSCGTGSMCLTNSNSSVGYPIASLIDEIYTIKDGLLRELEIDDTGDEVKFFRNGKELPESFGLTSIIADGGIRNYSDVNVALALGADYVMIGGLFSRMFESCAPFNSINNDLKKDKGFFYGRIDEYSDYCYQFCFPKKRDIVLSYENIKNKYNLNDFSYPRGDTSYIYPENIMTLNIPDYIINKYEELKKWLIKNADLYKSSHGMSTKEAQIGRLEARGLPIDYNKLKTSEGKTITQKVDYTIAGWRENMEDYLKSAMSYTNSKTLDDFKGKVMLVVKSQSTISSLNK